jgi:hypothetical protein
VDRLDKYLKVLVFAIYLSAAISMTPEQCMSLLREKREAAIHRYRFAVEQALARANFLNSQNLMLPTPTDLEKKRGKREKQGGGGRGFFKIDELFLTFLSVSVLFV